MIENNPTMALLNNSISKKKLELLQAFRGLAALLVLMFHVTELSHQKFNQDFFLNLFSFGKSGVDFFFVLSGFIIFFIHRFDIGYKEKLRPFLLKRFIRLYPMYWIVNFIILPIYFFVPSFGKGYEQDLGVIIKSLLLYPQEHFPILIIGWSLSYEILFYLVFSLAILLKTRLAKKIIFGWLAVTAILFLLNLIIHLDLTHFLWLNFIFNSHNLEFALGCLSAYFVYRYRIKSKKAGMLMTLGSLLFILSGISYNYLFSDLSPIIAYGISSMLIITGAASLDTEKSVKVPALFTHLGDASYSLYLIHYPCLSSLFKVVMLFHLKSIFLYHLAMALIIAITISLSLITYQYVEKPLVTHLRKNFGLYRT